MTQSELLNEGVPEEDSGYKNVVYPEEKFLKRIKLGMLTGWLSSLVTQHGRNIGALFPNERIEVQNIVIDGDISVVGGSIYRQESN